MPRRKNNNLATLILLALSLVIFISLVNFIAENLYSVFFILVILITAISGFYFINNIKKNKYTNYKYSKVNKYVDIDSLEGEEFEAYVASMLNDLGYTTEITKRSYDYGVDVIATDFFGIRIGIQCKRYSKTVGISAVQQAIAAKAYYNLDHVVVLTNQGFSNPAKNLAQANNCILIDRNRLIE